MSVGEEYLVFVIWTRWILWDAHFTILHSVFYQNNLLVNHSFVPTARLLKFQLSLSKCHFTLKGTENIWLLPFLLYHSGSKLNFTQLFKMKLLRAIQKQRRYHSTIFALGWEPVSNLSEETPHIMISIWVFYCFVKKITLNLSRLKQRFTLDQKSRFS